MMPMRRAEPDSTLEDGAVMDTSPAKIPLHKPPRPYFLFIMYRNTKTDRPPAAAASVVFIATMAAFSAVALSENPSVEPGLKPYHPIQRMNVPRTTRGREWGENS